MEIDLTLETKEGTGPLKFSYTKMVNAGFTGKNQEEVRHHLTELAEKGIEVPDSTPTLYPVVSRALSTEDAMEVFGDETSGELEYVLFIKNESEVYVGVGSDHTDRNLEEFHIPRSKQICPNITSKTVWPLEEIKEHWDTLSMRCSVVKDGDTILYQEGELGLLLNPSELMTFVKEKIDGPLDGTVIYSGTFKMLTDDFVFADSFSGELVDSKLNRKIEFAYDVKPLDYMEI
ncbi:Protein of unknown function [Desulfocicer vacuolatum DSM 3385]|uniref:DUF2848 domain-containing protein n=1 Tax=Desulfocicer vacuolatum DSM 3385 TaxID=1121400 RepID=A0A1W2AX67_9BACT|nr:DUF2848 family protein [Desulfocicer vacuolatum]SMC65305.1 Protein of unknown function [Desulfocicer vacuolatum DSM 3385]